MPLALDKDGSSRGCELAPGSRHETLFFQVIWSDGLITIANKVPLLVTYKGQKRDPSLFFILRVLLHSSLLHCDHILVSRISLISYLVSNIVSYSSFAHLKKYSKHAANRLKHVDHIVSKIFSSSS